MAFCVYTLALLKFLDGAEAGEIALTVVAAVPKEFELHPNTLSFSVKPVDSEVPGLVDLLTEATHNSIQITVITTRVAYVTFSLTNIDDKERERREVCFTDIEDFGCRVWFSGLRKRTKYALEVKTQGLKGQNQTSATIEVETKLSREEE